MFYEGLQSQTKESLKEKQYIGLKHSTSQRNHSIVPQSFKFSPNSSPKFT